MEKKAFIKAIDDYLSSEDYDLMSDDEIASWEHRTNQPIQVTPEYVMYEASTWVKSSKVPVWCLYRQQKNGGVQSIGLYCEGTLTEALQIYRDHIDILPNRQCYMGITITKKDKKNIS